MSVVACFLVILQATAFFQRERWITAVVLVATSPFMAYSYKMLLEGHWGGHIYHGWAKGTLLGKLFEVLIFNIVADTWFYWQVSLKCNRALLKRSPAGPCQRTLVPVPPFYQPRERECVCVCVCVCVCATGGATRRPPLLE